MKTMVRVYLPVTPADLEALSETNRLPGERQDAYAVTEKVRRDQPTEDPEVLEFGALQDAAMASGASSDRILVAAADMHPGVVREPDEGIETAVSVEGIVELQRVVSLHLGDPGDDGTGDDDVELSWYDVTELDQVRAELG
ncbi:DUF6912 family protein [Luteipulveratus mongoliensis]|uniref:Uncharacterized protein n=1 Tax=Luteipulveratus mongoliensis TaxID=571913 RepID=A0A0K1JI40_9MICO|nr:hypothetical protein [Luteipulveratus mongoliensis]AKU16245.1 hypothetical protein VV02_10855 [Luteipulveratus mongoliensis]